MLLFKDFLIMFYSIFEPKTNYVFWNHAFKVEEGPFWGPFPSSYFSKSSMPQNKEMIRGCAYYWHWKMLHFAILTSGLLLLQTVIFWAANEPSGTKSFYFAHDMNPLHTKIFPNLARDLSECMHWHAAIKCCIHTKMMRHKWGKFNVTSFPSNVFYLPTIYVAHPSVNSLGNAF